MELLGNAKDIPTLIAAGLVLITLHLVFRVGEFAWKMFEAKGKVSEKSIEKLTEALNKNTLEMEHLSDRIEDIEKSLVDIPKMKLDLRRLFTAVKQLSGERWDQIRKSIMEDEL